MSGAPGPGHGPTYTDLYGADPDEPAPADPGLAAELQAMTAAEHEHRAGASGGTPEEQLAWRRVTVRNGDRLAEILAERGWPVASQVGTAAARCAWLVAQHADRQLDVQRAALRALAAAVAEGAAEPRQLALLQDRVLVNEGSPQVYGTQIAGVEDGVPVPWPCVDPERLDARRAEVGLEPFARHIARFAPPTSGA